MSDTAVTVKEYNAIEATIGSYIQGAQTGKSSEMKAAFSEEATVYGYIGEDLFAGSIQKLYEWHDDNGAAKDIEARIVAIDIAGSIATARLEIENWTGYRFTDFFTLLKIEGQWKIMNKVFHLHG